MMKKTILLFVALLSISLFHSCREDGAFENSGNSQFGFTVNRDKDFIEKGVGEENQLKYNIVSKYKFETIDMKFKFSTNLNGILSLNGKALEANKEYSLTDANNIFSYVGNTSGNHKVTTIVTNAKGISVEEIFELKYAVSEFTHTFEGGKADINQGEPTNYLMKIVPSEGQPKTGYKIKFNSYDGEIQMDNIPVEIGKEYDLPNIDSFNVILTTNKEGLGALHYTIKNATVSSDYSIQQDIKKRQIVVESINISNTNVSPNTNMSLIGLIRKSPQTTNTSVQYKTWISSASNNNTTGIQNTNNAYIPYSLGENGSFKYDFKALEAGDYTYNIQFKDEFGNESDVKSYTIKVENSLTITTPSSVMVNLQRTSSHSTSVSGTTYFDIKHKYLNAILNVGATASAGNGISKVRFELNFIYEGQTINKLYESTYSDFPVTISLNNNNTNDSYELGAWMSTKDRNPLNASNGTYTLHIYDKFNNVVKEEGNTIVNIL